LMIVFKKASDIRLCTFRSYPIETCIRMTQKKGSHADQNNVVPLMYACSYIRAHSTLNGRNYTTCELRSRHQKYSIPIQKKKKSYVIGHNLALGFTCTAPFLPPSATVDQRRRVRHGRWQCANRRDQAHLRGGSSRDFLMTTKRIPKCVRTLACAVKPGRPL
jgi:hypothetical protein